MNVLLSSLIVVVGAVCFLAGWFSHKILRTSSDGLFIVNDSDEERTKWILDVKIDPETIPSRKEIHLKVKKMTEGDV